MSRILLLEVGQDSSFMKLGDRGLLPNHCFLESGMTGIIPIKFALVSKFRVSMIDGTTYGNSLVLIQTALKEITREGAGWICLAQGRIDWRSI